MPCCCWSDTKCDGEPVILLVLELEDIPGKGIAAGRWAGCGLKSALSNAEGKSRSRCIWIPSPGPIWLMWLKFDGAEIIFDRRSLLLFAREMNSQVRQLHVMKRLTLASKLDCFHERKTGVLFLADCYQRDLVQPNWAHFAGRWLHRKLWTRDKVLTRQWQMTVAPVYLCLCCANKRCKVAQQRN